jgi:hypothetical protein
LPRRNSLTIQLFGNCGHAEPRLALGLSAQLPDSLQTRSFTRSRAKRLPSFKPTLASANSIPGRTELQDDYRLLELRDCSDHLTDQRPRRIASGSCEVRPICRQYSRTQPGQLIDDDLINHEVTREAV